MLSVLAKCWGPAGGAGRGLPSAGYAQRCTSHPPLLVAPSLGCRGHSLQAAAGTSMRRCPAAVTCHAAAASHAALRGPVAHPGGGPHTAGGMARAALPRVVRLGSVRGALTCAALRMLAGWGTRMGLAKLAPVTLLLTSFSQVPRRAGTALPAGGTRMPAPPPPDRVCTTSMQLRPGVASTHPLPPPTHPHPRPPTPTHLTHAHPWPRAPAGAAARCCASAPAAGPTAARWAPTRAGGSGRCCRPVWRRWRRLGRGRAAGRRRRAWCC